MTFIAILFALIIERFLGALEDLRSFAWFKGFVSWFVEQVKNSSFLGGTVGVVLLLSVLLLPFYYLYAWLMQTSLLLGFVVALATLIYCLGPRSFYDQIKEFCLANQSGSEDRAVWYAEDLLGRPVTENERQHLVRSVTEAAFVAANDRLFGTLFWFAVLGPLGALLFRLSSQLKIWAIDAEKGEQHDKRFAGSSRRFYSLLAWLPAQLLAFSFAATGNFVKSARRCRHHDTACEGRWPDSSDCIVVCAGKGAIDSADLTEDKEAMALEARDLIRRSLILWLAIIALVTLLIAAI